MLSMGSRRVLGLLIVGECSVEPASWRRRREIRRVDEELLLSWRCGFNFRLVTEILTTVSGIEQLRLRVC